MPQNLTQEQYWQLFEKLPDELKSLILAEETAKNVFDICEGNEADIEIIPEVARYTGRVLLGLIPPDEFQKVLEKNLELNGETAKNIAQEINRFIFAPAKASLEKLYETGIGSLGETPTETSEIISSRKTAPFAKKQKGSDTYRAG